MPFVENSGGGGGGVTSVAATDTSIVVAGTATAPTIATGTLDAVAAAHPPAANWSNNAKKITGLANGTAATDAAAFGQIPDLADGQAGIMVPLIPGWVGINGTFTANRGFFSRFTLPTARTITSVKFRSNTAGTGNVDVCIIDSAGNILKSAGSTAGKKGANTWQSVSLSSSLALAAATVYYVGLVTDTTDGSYDAVFWNSSTGLGVDQMWGSTLGLAQSFLKDLGAFPFSGTITLGSANGSVGPIAGLI